MCLTYAERATPRSHLMPGLPGEAGLSAGPVDPEDVLGPPPRNSHGSLHFSVGPTYGSTLQAT